MPDRTRYSPGTPLRDDDTTHSLNEVGSSESCALPEEQLPSAELLSGPAFRCLDGLSGSRMQFVCPLL